MIAKPSNKGFVDLIPRHSPLYLPEKVNSKYTIVYRDKTGEQSISSHKTAYNMVIAYERIIAKGYDCLVFNDKRKQVTVVRRSGAKGNIPRYRLAKRGEHAES